MSNMPHASRFASETGVPATDQVALDRPIWAALTSSHAAIAVGGVLARRYPADVAPFAALSDTGPANFEALRALIPASGRVVMFTVDEITPPQGFEIHLAATGYQMVLTTALATTDNADIIALNGSDVPAMLHLVELTRPGPFGSRTHELGNYIGIRIGGELVAMAGERMRLTGYVEISAVCVRPDYRGKGYGRILISALAQAISQSGDIPLLHVFTDNKPAIALYHRLGFAIRQRLHVTILGIVANAK
jgi:predicted GNAT family acetyltransferase